MRKKILLLSAILTALAFVFFALIFSGCSAIRSAVSVPEEDTKQSSGFTESEVAETTGAISTPEGTTSEGYYAKEGASDATNVAAISGKVIKTASIELEVAAGEFEKKFFEISSLAAKYGGFVSGSQSYSDSQGKMTSGSLTLRIEQVNFDTVVGKIKELGTVKSVTLGGSDVTQEYIDLESRLKNLKAQEEVLLTLMEKSTKVEDSIAVQKELSNVQSEIEVIKGRMQYLDNMVSYSTIDVYLSEPLPISAESGGGFLDAVKRGARGALTVLKSMTVVFIVISPILVLAAIVLVIIWQSIRARNRRRARKSQTGS